MQTNYHISDGQSGGRYQLRHAAGLYWLIDMVQPEKDYIRPVPLNDVGAKLWRMIDSGTSIEKISEQLSAEYEISTEQAQSDVHDFIEQLQAMHVDLGRA